MIRAKILSLVIAAGAFAVPLSASAQQTPATPSYGRPSAPSTDEIVKGRVLSFDGAYALHVADERGFTDNVQLRQGTIINPTGITLAPGMAVTVHGVNRGSALVANEIDTPYNTYGVEPVYPYPAYPVYPTYPVYPAYPLYPYPYGYQPRVSIGIGFGGGFYGRGHFR